MSTENAKAPGSKFRLSVDGWAVTAALLLAVLVRLGLLKSVPW